MEDYTPRPQPAYPGEMTDDNIRAIFEGAGDFFARRLQCGPWTLYAYAIDGLISGGDASEYILRPITEHLVAENMKSLYDAALNGMVYNAVASACKDLDDVAKMLVNGFCVVLFPEIGAIAYEVKTGEKRGLSAPAVENSVKGPKDAFVETVRSNTSLVRRHLRTPDLRLYETTVGRRSLTNVTVLYIKGITNQKLVERMKRRLNEIDIDGFISPAAVEEYVTGSRKTAFPLLQYTERTDKFCQGLLDGRVGLIVDGLPLAYLAPVDLGYLMDSPEDRGRDFITASGIRILRYLALLASLLLPGIYIALATFHQQIIPLPMLRAIIESKKAVPFTTVAEVAGLLIAFELLQESGVHLPQAIGQSVSIIGGIVIGTAAVEAGLVSPVALIVVSIAGICGFVLPNRDFAEGVRVWRFVIAILAAFGGLIGVAAGAGCLVVHLSGLKSMGISYLKPNRDSMEGGGILRPLLKKSKRRNQSLKPEDERNQK
ncbi:MAG: spore germination protein [Oscillospiraceae bacterium]|nr:spore germination protein [Oscillospiraceae bacterium]